MRHPTPRAPPPVAERQAVLLEGRHWRTLSWRPSRLLSPTPISRADAEDGRQAPVHLEALPRRRTPPSAAPGLNQRGTDNEKGRSKTRESQRDAQPASSRREIYRVEATGTLCSSSTDQPLSLTCGTTSLPSSSASSCAGAGACRSCGGKEQGVVSSRSFGARRSPLHDPLLPVVSRHAPRLGHAALLTGSPPPR